MRVLHVHLSDQAFESLEEMVKLLGLTKRAYLERLLSPLGGSEVPEPDPEWVRLRAMVDILDAPPEDRLLDEHFNPAPENETLEERMARYARVCRRFREEFDRWGRKIAVD